MASKRRRASNKRGKARAGNRPPLREGAKPERPADEHDAADVPPHALDGWSERSFLRVVLGLTVAALALRLWALGVEEPWVDEVASFHWATAEGWFNDAWCAENNPPLYYWLLKVFIALFGADSFVLRLPSALAGALTVPLLALLGRRLGGAPVGLWAAAAACLSPIHIFYSQEARAYALLVLLVVGAWLALWRALERQRLTDWALLSALTAAAGLTHVLAPLGLLAAPLLLWAAPATPRGGARIRRDAGRLLLALAAAAAVCAVWVVAVAGREETVLATNRWIAPVWQDTPPALAIPLALEVLGIGPQADLLPITLKQYDTLAVPLALRVSGLLALGGIALWVASPLSSAALPRPGWRKLTLGCWLLAPPLVLAALSTLWRPIYVVGRYDLAALPALLLLLGLGLSSLWGPGQRGRIATAVLVVMLALPVGLKLWRYYDGAGGRKTWQPEVAALLDGSLQDGDLVIFSGRNGVFGRYHLASRGLAWQGMTCRDDRRTVGCRIFPLEEERRAGTLARDSKRVRSKEATTDAAAYLDALGPGKPGAIWVVLGGPRRPVGDGSRRLVVSRKDGRLLIALESRGYRALEASEDPLAQRARMLRVALLRPR